MTDTSYNPGFAPYANWATRQAPVPATVHNLPSSIAANGQVQSSLIVTEGFSLISAGITASQAGVMSIQRYLDAGGTVAQGAAVQVTLTAATAMNLDVLDGKPFASFIVIITNSSGSVSNLTNFALLLQASSSNLSNTGSSSGGGSQTVSWSGQTVGVTSLPAIPAGSNAIGSVVVGAAGADGSTSITTGGTAQNLFSGATPTNGFAIYNPDPTNDLWVSDSTTALANGQGSIRVVANGGGYETPIGYKPFGAISVVGATTGQKITARRW